jgi:hypothetical protein
MSLHALIFDGSECGPSNDLSLQFEAPAERGDKRCTALVPTQNF